MNEVVEVVEKGIATVSTPRAFKDKALARHTVAIEKLMNGVKKNMVEIAVRLREIKEKKLYEKDGYKDVFDYAGAVLDYKKPTVYKLIQCATKFIEVTPDGKSYASIITHDDEDYSVSQLMELNGLEAEEAIALDEANKIEPSMSAKEIREVVAEYKKQNEPKEPEEVDEEPEAVDEEPEEVDEEPEAVDEEPEEVDGTALAIMDVADSLINIMLDNRIEMPDKRKIEEFKNWILSIEL